MQDQDIPIDIHSGKLLDWMISRKVCNRDYQKNVLIIREKINNAIQDMPIHKGITQLVSGSYINYFHCKKIIDILKETEASSKNFFGSYGSQRMKDWLEIVRLYEKDKVYLAEAAQMLIRNVTFEVPLMKKDVIHCTAVLAECEKKEEARVKSIATARHEFDSLCKTLGIKGDKIKSELLARTSELPAIYASVAKSTKALDKPVEFYTEFVKFIIGKEHVGGCVPTLKHVITNGNTSVFEWTTGMIPPPRQTTEVSKHIDHDADSDNGIDLDVDEINFDELDFDSLDISVVNPGEEIDFGSDDAIDFLVESAEVKCSEEQYASVLDTVKTRDAFIDELRELEAFLKTRQYEMKFSNELLTLTQMQEAPTIVQIQTTESLSAMMDLVQAVISKMTDPVTHHLHNIKCSPRYVDNLTNTLKQKLNMIEKMNAMQSVLATKQSDTVKYIQEIQPKMKLIIEKTKELQGEIEQEISKLYKNRPVNIMGGINAL